MERSDSPNDIGMKHMASARKKSSERKTSRLGKKGARRRSAVFVVCVDNRGYPASLEQHKIYRSLPDAQAAADGDLRIVDESGEDYLYSEERFVSIDVPRKVAASFREAKRTASKTR